MEWRRERDLGAERSTNTPTGEGQEGLRQQWGRRDMIASKKKNRRKGKMQRIQREKKEKEVKEKRLR